VRVEGRTRDAKGVGRLPGGEEVRAGRHQVDFTINIDKSSRVPKHEGMRDGLEDVVAASTRLSHVDGEAGRLTLAGYAVEDLAPDAGFEGVAYLPLPGRLQ